LLKLSKPISTIPLIKKTFKLVILGDGGVGKTTFIRKHITGEFEPAYKANQGVQISPIRFSTKIHEIKFLIWDTAG